MVARQPKYFSNSIYKHKPVFSNTDRMYMLDTVGPTVLRSEAQKLSLKALQQKFLPFLPPVILPTALISMKLMLQPNIRHTESIYPPAHLPCKVRGYTGLSTEAEQVESRDWNLYLLSSNHRLFSCIIRCFVCL